jgi:hypothetical protein
LTNIFGEEKFSWQPSKIEVADGKKNLKTQRENLCACENAKCAK